MISEHAKAAKMIRKVLKEKFSNTRFKVRSSIYSGGDSVDISWVDGPSEDEVDRIVGKYQEGHFDGMEDLYKYDNKIEGIPQVTFVQCQRELSDEFIIKVLKENGYTCSKEELNSTNHELFDKTGYWTYRQLAWRLSR